MCVKDLKKKESEFEEMNVRSSAIILCYFLGKKALERKRKRKKVV